MARLRRKRDEEKLLVGINEPYRAFFKIHSRFQSKTNRHVAVLEPAHYESFLLNLSRDQSAPDHIKVLLFLIVSAGLRISEALGLQRMSFESENGALYFYSRVLKKKEFTERRNVVHPAIQSAVSSYLLKFRAFDKLFTIDRDQALYAVKKYIGPTLDLHAFRHAHVSYLLFEKEMSLEEAAALTKLDMTTVKRYSHLDPQHLLEGLYGKSTKSKSKPA